MKESDVLELATVMPKKLATLICKNIENSYSDNQSREKHFYRAYLKARYDNAIVAGADKFQFKAGIEVKTLETETNIYKMVVVPEIDLIVYCNGCYAEIIFRDIKKYNECINWLKANTTYSNLEIGLSSYCNGEYWKFL